MGKFRTLLVAIAVCLVARTGADAVTSLTLRDVIKAHLEDGPDPTSWDIDVALATLVGEYPEDAANIQRPTLDKLKDIFQFIPDSHPTVINGILKEEVTPDIIQAFLDMTLEDGENLLMSLQNTLGGGRMRCLNEGDVTSCYSNVTDVTTENPADAAYEECAKDLQPLTVPLIRAVLDYVIKMAQNVKKKFKLGWSCNFDVLAFIEVVQGIKRNFASITFPGWGWKLVDAMAKPPTALLGGQLQWVGGYEQCNNIRVSYTPHDYPANDTRDFGGRYCRVMIGTKENASLPLPVSLGFGLCVPDTCATDGVMDHLKANPGLIDTVLGAVGFEVKSVFCGNNPDYATDTRAQTAFGIIITLLTIVLCATLYDLVIRPNFIGNLEETINVQPLQYVNTAADMQAMSTYPDGTSPNGNVANGTARGMVNGHVPANKHMDRQASMASTKSLLSMAPEDEGLGLMQKPGLLDRLEAAFVGFSGSASLRKVFDVVHLGPHHMGSLDGIRFLSIVYAVGGNTCLFGILYTESITSSNLIAKLLDLPSQFAFQPIINYSFCTDSFLVVSGTVISYHWLRRLRKTKDHLTVWQIIHYYCHRYWSLMPVMMLTIMTYTCLYKYLLSGPISPPEITDAENCRTNWWTNLLMVGNLVNTDSSCLAWTWYVPMLFQLQLVTPVILIPLSYKRWAGWGALGLMYVIFLGTVSGVVKNQIYGHDEAWYYDYLMTPWCRAGPYLIGVGVGILLHDRLLHDIPKNVITKFLSVVLWLVSVGTILMCAFVSHTKYRKEDPVKWTEDQTISFHVFSRSAWGLAIAYMVLACETGFGGMMNSILAYRCFIPPSRMALPVLVFHAIFIFKFAYSQMDTIYINFNNLLYIFFGHLILIFLIGILASILFHFPFKGLEEAFFGAKTKLDIILAGSCPHSFRELKDNLKNEYPNEYELEEPNTEPSQGVTFM